MHFRNVRQCSSYKNNRVEDKKAFNAVQNTWKAGEQLIVLVLGLYFFLELGFACEHCKKGFSSSNLMA